tara:strand:+ start:58 stop:765 length:708 start_codon:yes stop_codon:yes gene_type:complete
MIKANLVYKTVLYILNKEQRGYLTPAEFNSVANQVQLEIFEKYFEDLNQQLRSPQNDSEYANRVKSLRERIQIFEKFSELTTGTQAGSLKVQAGDVHRVGTLELQIDNLPSREVQLVTRKEFSDLQRSKLTKSDSKLLYYYRIQDDFFVFPSISSSESNFVLYYVRKPKAPKWEYSTGSQGQYTYTGGVDFELSSVEQTEVILKILSYSGIIIRDPQIIQNAAQMAAAEDANEKS